MLTPIQESILVLSAMKNNFECVLKVFKRYIHDEDLKFSLQMKMIVDLSSFTEEWARLGPICKSEPQMVETLKICEPAITRLKSWGGIRDFRNKALAHGFREELRCNEGRTIYKPVDFEKWYFKANVPNNYAEILLIYEMAYFCMAIVINRHGSATDGLDVIYEQKVESKGIYTAEEFDKEMELFMDHISALDSAMPEKWEGYRKLVDIVRGQ
ncbi:hypothetical protein B9Q22_15960 [Enterobacter roggenkampii]|uniref:hypothetical protein n=1 Tax=Enterobacter roggenkampii TaxID=1812935 RepID=UPI000C1F088F|nr:hypothetical protein [Enterobacter roggenkampii]PJD13528.1 hypothetical protein B9Q25_09555 [Enterobacter roggenkampii]PJD18294.1 hypothetical protein B9Q21_13570 [Enterobacter roggenkampii]PJD19852.1 hypothetical protein B9Q22_15960 [Enterobacter roggenkampii]